MPEPRRKRETKVEPYKAQIRRWVEDDHLYNCVTMRERLEPLGYARGHQPTQGVRRIRCVPGRRPATGVAVRDEAGRAVAVRLGGVPLRGARRRAQSLRLRRDPGLLTDALRHLHQAQRHAHPHPVPHGGVRVLWRRAARRADGSHEERAPGDRRRGAQVEPAVCRLRGRPWASRRASASPMCRRRKAKWSAASASSNRRFGPACGSATSTT